MKKIISLILIGLLSTAMFGEAVAVSELKAEYHGFFWAEISSEDVGKTFVEENYPLGTFSSKKVVLVDGNRTIIATYNVDYIVREPHQDTIVTKEGPLFIIGYLPDYDRYVICVIYKSKYTGEFTEVMRIVCRKIQ